MIKLEMYCITNKVVNLLNETNYKVGWVGKEKPPNNYIPCNMQDNIFFKEKYYSELTFHYWYWKNKLDLNNEDWIGFCQKRRFWLNKESMDTIVNKDNFSKHVLQDVPNEWSSYNSIICEPIFVNKVKKMKMIKRGLRSIIKDPSILFNQKKQSLLLHFDMHHGYGNMEKAINLINEEDRNDFYNYLNSSTSYNPHIMFISKPHIANEWFSVLFPWLLKCEKIFGFEKLNGYDTQRLYAFLAERYLSFWFKKYTKSLNWPWMFREHVE
tara:strand:- start:420 stop:1223 length:804 start_codon:yes stop_codon:yes gene_type:complete